MAIRKQIMVKEETWRRLRALAFVTDKPLDGAVVDILERALGADPQLAGKVAQAEKAAA